MSWRTIPVMTKFKHLILVFIALIALAEKGAPVIGIPQGASPLSIWGLGTFDFYNTLKERYSHISAVTSLDQLEYPEEHEYCLFITISPEKPYTREEAELVIRELSECKQPALLIADEFSTSNVLLEIAGLSVRVAEGRMIYAYNTTPAGAEFSFSPYVKAVFRLASGETVYLTLDKASYIEGGSVVLGYAENIAIYNIVENEWFMDTVSRATVAAYDSNGVFRSIVISDGSIFLNQVLRSRYGGDYARVLLYYVDYLCGFSRNCAIAIDASKYEVLNAEKLFTDTVSNLQAFTVGDVVLAGVLYALKLVHPSTWLVPLLRYTGEVAQYLLNTPPLSYFSLIFTIALVSMFILRKTGERFRDERLGEVREVELYATADLVSAVSKGKYKLTRGDFASLYEIVDTYLKYALGCGLADARVADLLSRHLDREKALKYVTNMNKLYLKATGRKRLPLVLSWHRTVKKYIKLSEEVLKSIGFSLEAEKGYEYIAMVYKH